ncbi:hypothetical protein Y1Q_0005517 [Alligator mississippiensis]|uniref:Uncharacterized protein n=1 Tax=Alligator mississippiensis TaxID=8496 RepID=A0A151MEW9_ALLMI|nr:hypothetical protein Y1Q_0005517 [Alligator mississippiensis]
MRRPSGRRAVILVLRALQSCESSLRRTGILKDQEQRFAYCCHHWRANFFNESAFPLWSCGVKGPKKEN